MKLGLINICNRQHARSLRGTKVFGEISEKRFGRQSVISALKDKKFLAHMCFEGACDGPIQYLIETRVATKFDSGATRKLVESYGCEIIFLPPYSPDLNPIECYIVVELKADEFDPRDVGQMSFYLSAVDDLIRGPEDQPTIGMLLCKKRIVL